LRAARALLGWSRDTLAEKSGTAAEIIEGFESFGSNPKRGTMNRWVRAMSRGGVEFIDDGDASLDGGPGVRLRAGAPS
jgi:hypothetical protein